MTPSLYDQCAAHCYLYYVENRPVLSDYDYDILERQLEATGVRPPVHSDLRDSYTDAQIELAGRYAKGLES